MDGGNWCHQITGYLSIYTCLKPTNPPAQKKYSKFERICGYNCSFIIEKGPLVGWMAATGGELTQYLWKLKRLQVPPEITTVPLKCMAASVLLK